MAKRKKAAEASGLSRKRRSPGSSMPVRPGRRTSSSWDRPSNSCKRLSRGPPTSTSRSWSRCRASRPSSSRNGRWRTSTASAEGRPYNMIFVRESGASWDIYTLGCYRDLQHWAAPRPLTKEEREAAAKKAGFAGADAIGPYMRTLIDFHRDTMGVAIK
ncbi:MAG: hypothetical protein MZV63_58825 [Marinilabiliales bacterium]|nr:hypothetical protein [Marinilabiliales bacterium]